MVEVSKTSGIATGLIQGTTEDSMKLEEMTKQLLVILDQAGGEKTVGTPIAGKPELPPPFTDALEIADTLASLKSKINEAMTGVIKENIEKNRDSQRQQFKERIEQLQKAIEASKKASTWGSLGKLLGWVAPALMVAVGVVLVATGYGTALGAMLIAGGVVGLIAQGLQECGAAQKIQEGLASLFEKMGMSKDAAQIVATITYQVVVVSVMIAASMGAGAIGATGAAVSASTQIAVGVMQALLGVAGAGMGLGVAINEKEAADHQAKAAEINALLKQLQQKLEEQEDQLREVIESWEKGMDIVMNVIETQSAMAKTALQV